jgi:hypothetical protein
MTDSQRECPDDGACHHRCGAVCWRVLMCGPLSGKFPDDRWPPEILAANADDRPGGEVFLRGLVGQYGNPPEDP